MHIAVFLAVFALSSCDAARILMVPFMNNSRLIELDGIGHTLIERGHELHILLDSTTEIPKRFNAAYKKVSYKRVLGVGTYPTDLNATKRFFEVTKSGYADSMEFMNVLTSAICTDVMSDPQLFPTLETLKFDLVIVDNFILPCHYLIPYKLGLPFVASGTPFSAWLLRLPVLPSVSDAVIDFESNGLAFCSDSTGLLKRFCRLLAHVKSEIYMGWVDAEYLKAYMDFPPISEIRENASLTLINRHHLLSDHLPKLPHVEYVGGVTTKPAQPLPADLQQWMDESPEVVVVTFGSRLSILPDSFVEKLFTVFGQTPFRYLFRLSNTSYDGRVPVPPNVRTSDWIPQNDVLGHKHTKLFITHSGNNGQLEALYHGVPMLCFYLHFDQKNNARRVAKRGYGLMMDVHDFSSDQLLANVNVLLRNASFAQRIKKASRIFHSEKHPALRAADAIEHVLKYGAEHLRPREAYKLQWWQFYMLDVLALLYVSALVSLAVAYKATKAVLKFALRRVIGGRGKVKSD